MHRSNTYRKYLILITISLSFAQHYHLIVNCQVISHELRRLAVSTNHFGLDVLRSLDRIEPPDKVIVFCPLCLSSSLSMIIMGSSRYEVISSLRHALYIWSMRPKEINKAYLDMFNHVGLNQKISASAKREKSLTFIENPMTQVVSNSSSKNSFMRYRRWAPRVTVENQRNTSSNIYTARREYQSWPALEDENHLQLSLPKLMYLRERSFERFVPEPKRHHVNISSSLLNQINKSNKFVQYNTVDHKVGPTNDLSYHRADETIKSGNLDLSVMSQMTSIHSIYVQRGINIDYNYQALLRDYYKTVVHPVDFIRNGEETRQHINSLIATNTEGKIKDIIQADKINHGPVGMLLVSAFHFRGTLDVFLKDSRALKRGRMSKNQTCDKLCPSSTNKALLNSKVFSYDLHRGTSTRIKKENNHYLYQNNITESRQRADRKKSAPIFMETESTLLKYGSNANLDCRTIDIPFKNRLISLVIVIPNHANATGTILAKLNAQVLSDMINSLEVKRLAIQIPVIKFDRGPINVEGALRELGLSEIFFGGYNLAAISETGLNKWLRASDLIHETSIDIGTINPKFYQPEDRLKPAASNRIKLPYDGINQHIKNREARSVGKQEATIKLEGPFLYFVLDGINGLILAMGRVRQ